MCQSKERPDAAKVQLKVNGVPVDVNGFVQSILGSAIIGMVEQLKGGANAKRVEISVET